MGGTRRKTASRRATGAGAPGGPARWAPLATPLGGRRLRNATRSARGRQRPRAHGIFHWPAGPAPLRLIGPAGVFVPARGDGDQISQGALLSGLGRVLINQVGGAREGSRGGRGPGERSWLYRLCLSVTFLCRKCASEPGKVEGRHSNLTVKSKHFPKNHWKIIFPVPKPWSLPISRPPPFAWEIEGGHRSSWP